MLVQREMESWRLPLSEYTAIFGGSVGEHRPIQLQSVEQASAEIATGFKEEIRLAGPIQHRARSAPAADR